MSSSCNDKDGQRLRHLVRSATQWQAKLLLLGSRKHVAKVYCMM